jgi:hypothetical protein
MERQPHPQFLLLQLPSLTRPPSVFHQLSVSLFLMRVRTIHTARQLLHQYLLLQLLLLTRPLSVSRQLLV